MGKIDELGSIARLPVSRRMVLAAPSVAALLASGARAQDKIQPPKGQIVVGFTQEPTVFNPLMPRIETDQGIWFTLFNPLWRADPEGTFVAELAAEVPTLDNGGISADGLTWTIKLRKGVHWHDGVEFTAEDVKYTLELLNNPNFKAYTRQGHQLVRDITVHNPYELSWKMTRAYALSHAADLDLHGSQARAGDGSGSEHRALQRGADRDRAVQVGAARCRSKRHGRGQHGLLRRRPARGARDLQLHPRCQRRLHAAQDWADRLSQLFRPGRPVLRGRQKAPGRQGVRDPVDPGRGHRHEFR